jgi:hypothetical protein
MKISLDFKKLSYPWVFVFTCVILVCAVGLVFKSYKNITNKKQFRLHGYRSHAFPFEVDMVKSWMTFEFINHTFSLPPEYLKNEFAIKSLKYPRITLSEVAKSENKNIIIFVNQVKDSIRIRSASSVPIN